MGSGRKNARKFTQFPIFMVMPCVRFVDVGGVYILAFSTENPANHLLMLVDEKQALSSNGAGIAIKVVVIKIINYHCEEKKSC